MQKQNIETKSELVRYNQHHGADKTFQTKIKIMTNIYKEQILSQGKEPSNKVADLGEFPKTIYGRTFDTKEEYLDALHDFLNSN